MKILTIGSDGKLSLPKELLDHLGLLPGRRIEVAMLPGGQLEFTAAGRKAVSAHPSPASHR